MVHDYSRNTFARTHFTGDRFAVEQPSDDGRYHDAPGVRRPPISIDKALREHCYIPAKSYFVAVVLDDDTTAYFAGPTSIPEQDVPDFFQMHRYLRCLKRQGSGIAAHQYEDSSVPFDDYHGYPAGPHYPSRRGYDRRHVLQGPDLFDDETLFLKTRKRPRGHLQRREMEDDDAPIPITSSKKGIKIGNSQDVWKFYDQRFRNCQQTACKLIAKAWVKAVEPKKQSNHPYTGSDEKAPDWWPKAWGPTRDEKVRHKEPDHLYKKERVHLLNHILRMVVEPNAKQHPDIQKLNLNVAKLEEVTMDALSTFFADKENTNNAKKKPYLKEIFKVAKFEERYKNGEIDADTVVYIMADDKTPDNYQSDNEEGNAARDNDENDPSSMSSSVSPQKITAPHNLMPPSNAEQNHSSALQAAPFISDLPVRTTHYVSPLVPPDIVQEHHAYVDGSGIAAGTPAQQLQPHPSMAMTDICANPHDASRRSSIFSPPAEYSGSPTPGMYPANWQSGTTAPNNTTMYAFTQQHQQQHGQATFVPQPSVPISQGQQYMGTSFDGMPRAYDPGQANLFRAPSVHNPIPHSQAYPGYIENRAIPNPGLKMEPHGRPRLQ